MKRPSFLPVLIGTGFGSGFSPFAPGTAGALLASIIWFLKIYQGGKYCTFPHAIEFLNKKYADTFTILTSYPELENYLSPFMDAWESNAQDQLQVRP